MKFNVFQIICFLALFGFISPVEYLEAASPSYDPTPLRNHSLMFKMSVGDIQQINLDAVSYTHLTLPTILLV